MRIIERIGEASGRLAELFCTSDEIAELDRLDDETILGVIADAAAARKALDLLISAGSSVVARRSERSLGQSGLAQRKGHRTPTSLVQQITGESKGNVFRALQTGEELRDAATRRTAPPEVDAADAAAAPPPWHEPLTDALSAGRITHAQYDAIRRGLGEPPVERYPDLDPSFLPDAWRTAVTMLIDEAALSAIEDLRAAARIARDRLDPVGVTLRFDERYANRSFKAWIDEHGQQHAHIRFDDEAGAWAQAIISAALRPRRGPRFIAAPGVDAEIDTDAETESDSDSKQDADAAADRAAQDDRTMEQLQYDTFVAILRTGAAADPNQAFGDRQPGIRIVTTADDVSRDGESGNLKGTGYLEDSGQALPPGVLDKYLCDAATVPMTVDSFGNPLDLGREERLYTAKQRSALRIRDGGCLWPGCPAPPSQCEAHHSEHWAEHGGRTDIDLGLLLCMFHHLRLHNQGFKITRRDGRFWLYPPIGSGEPPVMLETNAPRRFAVA